MINLAIRNIIKFGDEVLNKKCRPVEKIDDRILMLLDDMHDTLVKSGGVGLAAPQVGILKRICVIDIGEGLIELINPEIIKTSGSVNDVEGCLSVPGRWGYVTRPKKVTVRALDRNGKQFEMTGEDLLARAFCHEIDHLDGVLFTTHVTEFVDLERDED